MVKRIENTETSYYAPLPEGQGVMMFGFRDRPFRFQSSQITGIFMDSENDLIIQTTSKQYDFGKELNPTVIEDMYFRGLRGEIARYAEYNDEGLRIDGTPLLIMQDYHTKAKLAEARRQHQHDKKLNLVEGIVKNPQVDQAIEPPLGGKVQENMTRNNRSLAIMLFQCPT